MKRLQLVWIVWKLYDRGFLRGYENCSVIGRQTIDGWDFQERVEKGDRKGNRNGPGYRGDVNMIRGLIVYWIVKYIGKCSLGWTVRNSEEFKY